MGVGVFASWTSAREQVTWGCVLRFLSGVPHNQSLGRLEGVFLLFLEEGSMFLVCPHAAHADKIKPFRRRSVLETFARRRHPTAIRGC